MSQIAHLLEPMLTSGALRGVGLDDAGRLCWIPPQAWRRMVRDQGNPQRPMVSACLGTLHMGTVEAPQGALGQFTKFQAYLPHRSFNEVFGLEPPVQDFPIAEPQYLRGDAPNEPVPLQSTELVAGANSTPATPVGEANVWMRGYAQGVLDRGARIKREDGIKACMGALFCTYAVAEAAYQALPHPTLRNPPRTTKDSG